MSCPHCPAPDRCLAWPVFCEWASTGDPVKLAHIRHRAAHGAPAPADPGAPTAAEALALTRSMRACPYRSTGPGCGCSGARCALRRGAIVSHLDCFACVRAHG